MSASAAATAASRAAPTRAVELLKRRGFLLPTASIYQGLKGSVDLGPLAVQLKRNIERHWWRTVVDAHPEIHGFQSPILTPAQVLRASGHAAHFADLLVDDKLSGARFRADKAAMLVTAQVRRGDRLVTAVPIRAPSKSAATQWEQLLKDSLLPRGSWVERKGDVVHVFVRKIVDPVIIPGKTAEGSYESPGTIVLEPLPPRLILGDKVGVTPGSSAPLGEVSADLHLEYRGYANPENNSPFLTAPRPFNLLFKTFTDTVDPIDQIIAMARDSKGTVGGEAATEMAEPAEKTHEQVRAQVDSALDASTVYLRPETAQGVYTAFPLLVKALHLVPPFGIAQAGKAFRNEIRTEHLLYRTLEFEQLELQYFVAPWAARRALVRWQHARLAWWRHLAADPQAFRLRAHEGTELAHYARACSDIEFQFPWGWGELEGVAHRGRYDLECHAKASGVSMQVYDKNIAPLQGPAAAAAEAEDKEAVPRPRYTPYVIEASAGLSRAVLALLFDAYTEVPLNTAGKGALRIPALAEANASRQETTKSAVRDAPTHRVVLRLHPAIAPCTLRIFPVVGSNQELVNLANQVYQSVQFGHSLGAACTPVEEPQGVDKLDNNDDAAAIEAAEAAAAAAWQSQVGDVVGAVGGSALGWTAAVDTRGSIGKRYQQADEIGVPVCVTVDDTSLRNGTVTVRHRDTTEQTRVTIGDLVPHIQKTLRHWKNSTA